MTGCGVVFWRVDPVDAEVLCRGDVVPEVDVDDDGVAVDDSVDCSGVDVCNHGFTSCQNPAASSAAFIDVVKARLVYVAPENVATAAVCPATASVVSCGIAAWLSSLLVNSACGYVGTVTVVIRPPTMMMLTWIVPQLLLGQSDAATVSSDPR